MNWGRVSFDASAYMLFEASGDSEVECVDVAIGDASEAESEDDALSCSNGSSPECADVHLEVDAADGGRFGYSNGDHDNVGGGSGLLDYLGEHRSDSEDEDGVVDQCCGGPTKDPVGDPKDESETEDSRGKREGDRLFWEACLQS